MLERKTSAALSVIQGGITRTSDEWAEVIKADLGRSIEGIIAAGQHLIDAKAELAHGEWISTVENKIGIQRTTAFKFMQLARHPVVSNVANRKHLPSTWTVLVVLTRLEPTILEAEIASGTVTQHIDFKTAQALVRKHKPSKPEPEPEEPPEGKPAIAARKTQKHQVNALERTAADLTSTANILTEMFSGGFQFTCTPEVRSKYGTEIRDAAKRIQRLMVTTIIPKEDMK